MHYSIEKLLNGDPVAEYFPVARQHWQEVLSDADATDSEEIARIAGLEQMWFEHNCGGRYIGQEIMVCSGICQYYATQIGFGEDFEKAKAMYRGLRRSNCSVEIHHHAKQVARIYEEIGEED